MLSRRSFLDRTVSAGLASTGFALLLRPASAAPSLKLVPGSPFGTGAAGTSPYSAAFHPSGNLLATPNNGGNSVGSSVSLFSVQSSGGLAPLGSPLSTGPGTPNTVSVAFSSDGRLLAAANYGSTSVAVFSLSPPAPVPGSPFATGPGKSPYSIAFTPKPLIYEADILVAANWLSDNTISVFRCKPGGTVGTPV